MTNQEQYDEAFEALQRQRKYRWHDLRKNPEDLPNDGECIETCHKLCGKICYGICTYTEGRFEDSINPPELLIKSLCAWREIEPFKEDE